MCLPDLENAPSTTSRETVSPCSGCGLVDAKAICTLSMALFTTEQMNSGINKFTPSSPAVRAVAQYRIEDGEAKLRIVRMAIARLKQHAQNIALVIGRHRGYLSPIFSLPDDVLRVVFEHVTDIQWDFGPWAVASVCKRWREVALSCSVLWTNISLERFRGRLSAAKRLWGRLAVQLSRTGQRHLHLSIDTSQAEMIPRLPYGKHVSPASLIARSSYAPLFNCMELLGSLPRKWGASPNLFPALTTLTIDHISWLEAPLPFSFTSTLTDLAIKDISLDSNNINMNNLALTLNGLKRLAFASCSLPKNFLLELLHLMGTSLRKLEFLNHQTTFFGMSLAEVHEIVTLPNLLHFSSSFDRSTSPAYRYYYYPDRPILANLRAPRLQSLRLSGLSKCELDAAQDFVYESGNMPRLENLDIKEWNDSPQSLVSFMRRFARLRRSRSPLSGTRAICMRYWKHSAGTYLPSRASPTSLFPLRDRTEIDPQ